MSGRPPIARYAPATRLRIARSATRPLDSLRAELLRQHLPRAVVAGAAGLSMGTFSALFRLSPLSYRSTVVTATFWFASLMLVTFKRRIRPMLTWLLLLDASLGIYQVSIYSDVGGGHVFLRIGPVLLGALILYSVCRSRPGPRSPLPLLWIVGNIPALIPLSHDLVPLTDGLLFWCLSVLYPVTFYLAMNALRAGPQPVESLEWSLLAGLVAISLVPLLLLPLEISQRATGSVSELQVGARSYATLGIVFLCSAVLLDSLRKTSMRLRVLATIPILSLFAFSFSRGALVCGLTLFLGIVAFGRGARLRFFVGTALSVLIMVQVVSLVSPNLLEGAGHFWLLRTNVASNVSAERGFDLTLFFASGRDTIWDFGVSAWKTSLVWGHGIGSTPYLFREASNGELSYSGMHNLILTVLAERGVFGLFAVVLLLGRVLVLVIRGRRVSRSYRFGIYAFGVFLLFASTTGVELFLNSTRAMNASVTVYLFAYIAFLEARNAHTGRTDVTSIGHGGLNEGTIQEPWNAIRPQIEPRSSIVSK